MEILSLPSSPGAERFPDGCGNVLWSLQNQYEKHKEVEAAQGVKILGKDLEKTLAGLPLLVAHKEDEIPVLKVSGFPLEPPDLSWGLGVCARNGEGSLRSWPLSEQLTLFKKLLQFKKIPPPITLVCIII